VVRVRVGRGARPTAPEAGAVPGTVQSPVENLAFDCIILGSACRRPQRDLAIKRDAIAPFKSSKTRCFWNESGGVASHGKTLQLPRGMVVAAVLPFQQGLGVGDLFLEGGGGAWDDFHLADLRKLKGRPVLLSGGG